MNRRDFLHLGSCATGGVLAARRMRSFMSEKVYAAVTGLKDYASSQGVLVGAALDHRWTGNPALLARYRQDCDIVTPIYELKWGAVRPTPDGFDFSAADAFVADAQQNSWKIHAHNLIPGPDNGGWLKGAVNSSNARQYLEQHVKTVVSRYRGKFQSWDVVNEALAPWLKTPDLLSQGLWLNTLGPQYIDYAFFAAASADPSVRLVWNEHHLEHATPMEAQCRKAALSLLKSLKSRGVPVQVLGLQSHLRAEDPVGGPDFENFLQEVLSMGVEIYITEMDVDDTHLQGSQAQRDNAVAAIYEKYLETVMRVAHPKVIIFWQLSDQNNWIDWDAKTNPAHRRADGAPHRIAPLDTSMQNKPAYNAIVQALQKH
jgi:endo-1,4-beta-xylanase